MIWQLCKNLLRAAVACLLLATASQSPAEYKVERVVAGLNQPTSMTQAPGDNNSIYIVERADNGNSLGRIRNYNLQTGTFSTFLDLGGTINSDGGLLSMKFHPDYQTNGLFYVVSNDSGSNRLDEYKTVGGTPQFQRRLLEYHNLNNVFHTMNEVHFRPNGNNNELFLTTGDGGTQADDPDYDPALVESPDSPYGKLMKIDLTASFPTPATGPTHAGIDVVALGLRNPFRSGFDRQTGDFYLGDVGFNTAEEVDFIPSSHFTNPAHPILDFGWTDREGTVETDAPYAGGPGSPGDINPIFDYAHSGQPLPHPSLLNGQSITGGYLYRGPVTELQGRYFFSDFTNGNVYSGTFNTSTNVSSYNGTNLTNLVNHTTAFETSIGGGANIQYVTSFGEDNTGNLYIVKFGNGFFPPLGQGEIFRITQIPANALEVTIDRATGAVTVANSTGAAINFTSLTLNSATGAIYANGLTPITGHYDSVGNGTIDNNNAWQITSAPGNTVQFREASLGDQATLANGASITYSPSGGWIQSPVEDWTASVQLAAGGTLAAVVRYVGNGGHQFERSDLNFDGSLTAADWSVFIANAATNLGGLSVAQAYGRGDLDGDNDNDYNDFKLFKADYIQVNGAAAFAALVQNVPEPGTVSLAMICLLACGTGRRRRLQPLRDSMHTIH
ncbi:MAG: PQQ-dependent sugar dehydrogenase [Pirellulales bacterium]